MGPKRHLNIFCQCICKRQLDAIGRPWLCMGNPGVDRIPMERVDVMALHLLEETSSSCFLVSTQSLEVWPHELIHSAAGAE